MVVSGMVGTLGYYIVSEGIAHSIKRVERRVFDGAATPTGSNGVTAGVELLTAASGQSRRLHSW